MSDTNRCVIVGGAPIENYEYLRSFLHEDDYAVYCDAGLMHEKELGVRASLVVGDFDSHERPVTEAEVIVLPHEKDDTDTFYAVKECLKRGFTEFLLLGMTGGRLDHTLGNLQALVMLDEAGVRACMVDDYSEILVVSGTNSTLTNCETTDVRSVPSGKFGPGEATVTGEFAFFSLLAVGCKAHGVSVAGAKYPLTGATLTGDFPLGVSNEVLPGEVACITVESGRVLLIKVIRDV